MRMSISIKPSSLIDCLQKKSGSDLEKKCSMKSYYYTILIFGHRIKDIIIAVEDKPVLLQHSSPKGVGNRLKARGMTTKFQNSRKFENAENLGGVKNETPNFSNC